MRIFASCICLIGSLGLADGLSTIAPPKSGFSNLLAGPLASLERTKLKKELVQAAKQKDEAAVLSVVEALAPLNPTDCPTKGLKGFEPLGGTSTTSVPLNGKWKLLFTNARDAEAPARTEKNQKDKPFGDAVASGVEVKTGQRIDAAVGECVNFIQLSSSGTSSLEEEGKSSKQLPFDRLDITIQMTPISKNRVRLDFEKGRVQNPNAPLPALRDFRFSFPPAWIGDGLTRLKGKDPAVEPSTYFDVLYIDDEIRCHRTGEGKLFVQQRDR